MSPKSTLFFLYTCLIIHFLTIFLNFQIQPVVHSNIVAAARWKNNTNGMYMIKWELVLIKLNSYPQCKKENVTCCCFFIWIFNLFVHFIAFLPTERSWFLQCEFGSRKTLLKTGKVFCPWWRRKCVFALVLCAGNVWHQKITLIVSNLIFL